MPRCCFEFCAQLWANDVFELVSRDGDVVAVRVRLNQFEVEAVEITIQEIVIELEHHHLCQLIHSNSVGIGAALAGFW